MKPSVNSDTLASLGEGVIPFKNLRVNKSLDILVAKQVRTRRTPDLVGFFAVQVCHDGLGNTREAYIDLVSTGTGDCPGRGNG